MKIDPTRMPINIGLGLQWHPEPEYIFSLERQPTTENFLGTIHAAAVYALVDATSGEVLQRGIELDWDRYFAVSRDTVLTIKKPSRQMIKATGHIDEEDIGNLAIERIDRRIQKVRIHVQVFNEDDDIAAKAEVTWVLGRLKNT